MLTLEEPEVFAELRRELVGFLHLSREEYEGLDEEDLGRALEPLSEIRSSVDSFSLEQLALRISIPPMLRASRLRQVLHEALETLLGREVSLSFRLPGELAETVEAAREVSEDWPHEDSFVLCFTDEDSVGEPKQPLIHLKRFLEEKVSRQHPFPLNHYDILCLWGDSYPGPIWGPDQEVARGYSEWLGTPVAVTARSLQGMVDFLGTW